MIKMIIDLNEEAIIKWIIKAYIPVTDIWVEDIEDNVRCEVENWLAEYGVYNEIVDKIVERLKDMNIEVEY